MNQAVKLAQRHKEVRSLVLLAGPVDGEGMRFLQESAWLPIFTAAAADDQYDTDARELMQWIAELPGNPRSRFMGFAEGRHGTEIFGPHPELPKAIVDWYADTLVENVADPKTPPALKQSPMREFWETVSKPEGVRGGIKTYRDARARTPDAVLFPESALNVLGYQYLQSGHVNEAIELFRLNTEAYPASANTYDSLGDGYLAAGQRDLALQASKKALELLASDRGPAERKDAIRTSAEAKIRQLQGGGKD